MKRFVSSAILLLVIFSRGETRVPGGQPDRSAVPSDSESRRPGRDPTKVQVLILTGYNMHDWRPITEALRATLEVTGRFEVRVNEEPIGCDEATFAGYDAIVLNFT